MKIEVKLKMHGKINKPDLNSQAFDVILKLDGKPRFGRLPF